MRLRSLRSSLRSLAAVTFVAAAAPAVVSAQTLTYDATQPMAFNNGTYLVGPMAGTFAAGGVGTSSAITMFCVDILNQVSYGQSFAVNVSNLNGGAIPNTRHPASLAAYRQTAFLSTFFLGPQSTWTDIQYAMWELMNPGSAPTSANRAFYLGLANAAATANFGAFTYSGTSYSAFNYTNYRVLTVVGAAGVADDALPQEFITGDGPITGLATPEPATIVLVAGGVGLIGFVRRRRAVA